MHIMLSHVNFKLYNMLHTGRGQFSVLFNVSNREYMNTLPLLESFTKYIKECISITVISYGRIMQKSKIRNLLLNKIHYYFGIVKDFS